MEQYVLHKGGCHCGKVRYEVDAPGDFSVTDCNCSICTKSGYLHLIVHKSRFRLLSGEDNLQKYTFDTHEAQHFFCTACGIKSFYVPRSHPDGISVNVHCLDEGTFKLITVNHFDGKNWEANKHKLTPLNQDE